MLILTIRSDKPDAEIGLYGDSLQTDYMVWTAHRQLAEGLHAKIRDFLMQNNKQLSDIRGIVCYCGPGSFTGLRIGLSVANALAFSMNVPIVGEIEDAQADWRSSGVHRILDGGNDHVVKPEYGAPVHITLPRTRTSA